MGLYFMQYKISLDHSYPHPHKGFRILHFMKNEWVPNGFDFYEVLMVCIFRSSQYPN